MRDPIQEAETKAQEILGKARVEAGRILMAAQETLASAKQQKADAENLMVMAKREIERMRLQSQALEGNR